MKPFFERYRAFNDDMIRRQRDPLYRKRFPLPDLELTPEELALRRHCSEVAANLTVGELCSALRQWQDSIKAKAPS